MLRYLPRLLTAICFVPPQAAMAAPFQGAIPFMVRQDRWAVDIEFGRQFVQGCNPHNFRVARTVPWAFRWGRMPRSRHSHVS